MKPGFAWRLIEWQGKHGRRDLPWQNTGSAYKTWLSEVMLQQTQVATVLGYFQRFTERFPTVEDLAVAESEEVMQLWQGLGYYSRARNLHACAKQVVARFNGEFPSTVPELESLPGIGRSTAGAIVSLGHGLRAPILDGNVKRVFCRHQAIFGYPEQSAVKKKLWQLAEDLLPDERAGQYNQALMDLGATVCTSRNPNCGACPVSKDCLAFKQGATGLLPTPKPRKERVQWFFIALLVEDSHGRQWMALQPDSGLWRGLWMPPILQLPSDSLNAETLREWLDQLGLDAEGLDELALQPWLVHDLTHRQMHFKCLRLKADSAHGLFESHAPGQKPEPRVFQKLRDHVSQLMLR